MDQRAVYEVVISLNAQTKLKEIFYHYVVENFYRAELIQEIYYQKDLMPEEEPQNQTSILNTTYELTNESPFLRIQNFGFMRILCRKCRSPGGRGGVIDQQSLILDNGMKKNSFHKLIRKTSTK